MNKRTKIIATIGPASSSPAMISKLIRAGMDAARLNFSHGDRKDHKLRIRLIRSEAAKAGKHIAIIQDLQGPKLRVGAMKDGGVKLGRGSEITAYPPEDRRNQRGHKRGVYPPHQGLESRRPRAAGRRKARAEGDKKEKLGRGL